MKRISAASTNAGTQFAILRSPGQDGPSTPADILTRGLDTDQVISPELRAAVQGSSELRTHSQSVSLTVDGVQQPGLVIGSILEIRGARYELYLVYNIADVAQTLGFVQQTLVFGGFALVLLIGAVTYIDRKSVV